MHSNVMRLRWQARQGGTAGRAGALGRRAPFYAYVQNLSRLYRPTLKHAPIPHVHIRPWSTICSNSFMRTQTSESERERECKNECKSETASILPPTAAGASMLKSRTATLVATRAPASRHIRTTAPPPMHMQSGVCFLFPSHWSEKPPSVNIHPCIIAGPKAGHPRPAEEHDVLLSDRHAALRTERPRSI